MVEEVSFKDAENSIKKGSKTFYFASRFMNRELRNSFYAVYASVCIYYQSCYISCCLSICIYLSSLVSLISGKNVLLNNNLTKHSLGEYLVNVLGKNLKRLLIAKATIEVQTG